jgi:hypothetical protein
MSPPPAVHERRAAPPRLGASCLALVVPTLVGCTATCPTFDSGFRTDRLLWNIPPELQADFCDAQRAYVLAHLDPATYARATCLLNALYWSEESPPAADRAECEARFSACMSSPPPLPYVDDCELPTRPPEDEILVYEPESVWFREHCLSEEVCAAWPTFAAELHCGLADDWRALDDVLERAHAGGACRIPI